MSPNTLRRNAWLAPTAVLLLGLVLVLARVVWGVALWLELLLVVLLCGLTWWWARRCDAPASVASVAQPLALEGWDQVAVGLATVSPDGRWLSVNAHLCRLLGRSAHELLGRAVAEWSHPDDAHPAEPSSMPAEQRFQRANGDWVWLRVTRSLQRGGNAAEPNTLLLLEDIRALKAEQAHRHEEEKHLNQLLDAMPDPFWIKDLQGRYLRCSRAFARLFGKTCEQVQGGGDTDLVEPQLAERLRQREEAVIAAGVPLSHKSLWERTDGSVMHVDILRAPVFDASGELVGIMGIGRDVTEQDGVLARAQSARDQAQALLEQADASRRALLSVVEDQQATELALRASESRLSAVIHALPDAVLTINTEGRIVDVWSDPESAMVNNREAVIGRLVRDFADSVTVKDLDQTLEKVFSTGRAMVEYTQLNQGALHRYEARWARVDDKLALTMVRDVTERHRAAEHQRLAAAVFEHAQEGVLIADVKWAPVSINRAFTELFGYTLEDLHRLGVRTRRARRQDPAYYRDMGDALRQRGHWAGEVWYQLKSGEEQVFWQSIVVVHDDAGAMSHYVCVYTDISELKASEARLEHLAHHDTLTQLPNRLFFLRRLDQALHDAQRKGRSCAVLMLDLDRFKDVNDSYGHLAGDELLRLVAARLGQRVRRSDTLARLGGDEFALLLEDVEHADDAARLANELIATLMVPLRLGPGQEVTVGASVGISLFPQHGSTPEDLLQGADAALYHAKAQGRGVFRYYSDEMTRAARERLELESRLRRALAMGELSLHYQPQVDIASGQVLGAEALLRWFDPVGGSLISPSRFIPVAEATGLIAEIGAWVLRETCRQGRAWLDSGLPALRLAVNVSPRQFHRVDLAAQIMDVLQETGFPAKSLELELTEGALMEREADALGVLQRLRGLGVGLAIDDFGTGYSSLAYLRRFPLDVLKIDRSFIAEIPHANDAMEIAAAIIAMGHSLGIRVLAEGVETAEQLDFLRAQGCDLYQGFLRSQALPPAEFEALLRQQDQTPQSPSDSSAGAI